MEGDPQNLDMEVQEWQPVGISHCASKRSNDRLPPHNGLQYRTHLANLVNFQIDIEFLPKSRVDIFASKHAFPVIFLKYSIDEVERRDHDILLYHCPLYDNSPALNPSQCNDNFCFGFLVVARHG